MFKNYSRIAEVYEQKEVTENWFTKSTFVRKYKNYKGHLKAQTLGSGIELSAFGKIYKFTTDIVADINEGDRLLIDGVYYDVKAISDFDGTLFSTKQILLNKNLW